MWTEGQRWPEGRAEALAWLKQRGYAQFTQAAESKDRLTFTSRPAITRQSYLRVSRSQGQFYGMARLGQLLRAKDPLETFELGADPFRDTSFAGRVRHVALLPEGNRLNIFFTAIGDAPERIYHTAIDHQRRLATVEGRTGLRGAHRLRRRTSVSIFPTRSRKSVKSIPPRDSFAIQRSCARTERSVSLLHLLRGTRHRRRGGQLGPLRGTIGQGGITEPRRRSCWRRRYCPIPCTARFVDMGRVVEFAPRDHRPTATRGSPLALSLLRATAREP